MTKTYAQLSREIASLQAAAEKLRTTEVKAAVAKANELIATYGLAVGDLSFAKSAPAAAAKSAETRYSDGLGHVWGGRGPRPVWLRDALAAGRTLQSFESGAPAATAPTRASAAKKSGFKVAIKYRDAATGNSWSGRGSQPAWLKAALKKRGVKIGDFLVDASATPAAAPAAAAASRKPAAKKQAAKPAVKKSVAAKKPAAKAPAAKKSTARPSAARKAKAGGKAGATAVADAKPSSVDAVLPA